MSALAPIWRVDIDGAPVYTGPEYSAARVAYETATAWRSRRIYNANRPLNKRPRPWRKIQPLRPVTSWPQQPESTLAARLMKLSPALPVVFRIPHEGLGDDVQAVFPTLHNGNGLYTCYAHIGQHGVCSRDWFAKDTRPATEAEAAPLLAELRSIYETGDDPVRLAPAKRVMRWA